VRPRSRGRSFIIVEETLRSRQRQQEGTAASRRCFRRGREQLPTLPRERERERERERGGGERVIKFARMRMRVHVHARTSTGSAVEFAFLSWTGCFSSSQDRDISSLLVSDARSLICETANNSGGVCACTFDIFKPSAEGHIFTEKRTCPAYPPRIVIGPILGVVSLITAVPFSSHIIRRLSREWNRVGLCQDYVKTERTRAFAENSMDFLAPCEQLAVRTARAYPDSSNLLDFTSCTHPIIRALSRLLLVIHLFSCF